MDKKIPCEVYSRIVGYLRPIQDWNESKQQEFADRVVFDYKEIFNKKDDIYLNVKGLT